MQGSGAVLGDQDRVCAIDRGARQRLRLIRAGHPIAQGRVSRDRDELMLLVFPGVERAVVSAHELRAGMDELIEDASLVWLRRRSCVSTH